MKAEIKTVNVVVTGNVKLIPREEVVKDEKKPENK